MSGVRRKNKTKSVEELLYTSTPTDCDEIEVRKIRPFKEHPFKVLDDDKMHELVESIILDI